MLEKELEGKQYLQKHLFEKGYLITNAEIKNPDAYPLYGNWTLSSIDGFNFWINQNVKLFIKKNDTFTLFLIGHCYDPYRMIHEESEILELLSQEYTGKGYQDLIDELTGIFIIGSITNGNLEFQVDASGIQCAYYGLVDGKVYVSSHS